MLLGSSTPLSAHFVSFTALRFKMYPDALFITGAFLLLTPIALIFSVLDLSLGEFFLVMLLTISIVLAASLLESSSFLSSSSAAPPACLDGFIVETNGGTGEAYTCTPLHP